MASACYRSAQSVGSAQGLHYFKAVAPKTILDYSYPLVGFMENLGPILTRWGLFLFRNFEIGAGLLFSL